jgi:hypothetical protein
MATATFSTGISIGRALELATQVSELAETAFSSVAALEQFLSSPYFSIDGAGLGELDAVGKIKGLVERLQSQKPDSRELSEILVTTHELYTEVEAAMRSAWPREGGDDA